MKYHVEMTHNEQRLGNVIKRLQNELAEAECQLDELAKALEYTERTGLDSFYHVMTDAELLTECAARMSTFGEHGWAMWLRRKAGREASALAAIKGAD